MGDRGKREEKKERGGWETYGTSIEVVSKRGGIGDVKLGIPIRIGKNLQNKRSVSSDKDVHEVIFIQFWA